MVGDGGRPGYTDTFHCVTFDGYAFYCATLAASTGQAWFEWLTDIKSSTSVTDVHLDANSRVVGTHKHPEAPECMHCPTMANFL